MSSVVVCTWNAKGQGLGSGDQEAMTIGRGAADALGAELRLVALGGVSQPVADEAGRYGAVAIDRVEDAKLAGFSADAYVEALAQYCAEREPALILTNQTFDVRLVAPRLARRIHAGVVMNAVAIDASAGVEPDPEHEVPEDHILVTTAAYGGDTRTVYALTGADTFIVCLSDNACQPEPAASATAARIEDVPVDLSQVAERIRVLEAAAAHGPKLEDANVIVAGGRGLGEAENFRLVEQLADALGGIAGASRPIVDDGWADASRQVGLTGKITKPALYIAAGISGASQHMVGCSAAKTIVAINTDPDAAIFRHARYGIVGNCLEILPELARALKA